MSLSAGGRVCIVREGDSGQRVTVRCHSSDFIAAGIPILRNHELDFGWPRFYHQAQWIADVQSGRSLRRREWRRHEENHGGLSQSQPHQLARGPALSPALALGRWPLTRHQILRKLRIDVRGFYRDLEALRELGVEVVIADDNRYSLAINLEEALARLPSPIRASTSAMSSNWPKAGPRPIASSSGGSIASTAMARDPPVRTSRANPNPKAGFEQIPLVR